MLDKTYNASETERKHYESWEQAGAFKADPSAGKKPYTIMMPPPNVTGILHMGHALTFTLQDVLIRYHRKQGYDALWQPGTDHAGIATQMVVERELDKEGISRREMGRDKFLERVWEWKKYSGGQINNQMRRLGATPDWERDRFTMDEGMSNAVRKVFVDLYRKGLIYKDKRLVNWDPKLMTAVSDLEVNQEPHKGTMYYIHYPVVGEDCSITVATTRPETMLGDTGVAVHPEDDRYMHLIGKKVLLPLVGREIPIVGDEHSDPEKGTGAVKMTPAHDFNDFEVAGRHGLELVNILTETAHLNDTVPEAYRGMERFEARKKVLADLEDLGLLEKVEDHEMVLPKSDRTGVIIEPRLTDQWYVNAEELAKPAIKAVEDGDVQFFPKHHTKTYFDWMLNIQPWCISRQLWWGHQIPAWYGPDGEVFVADNESEALELAAKHYGETGEKLTLTRDEDVLDTWFSSALYPFSTLGWPEQTPELGHYFPTDVLITGSDIIFFWVARMIMMSLEFMDEVPFKHVYINALVKDAKGQKMSKSKGNIVDPLEMMDKYGTDAFRFNLCMSAVQGRDVRLSERKIEGHRNFVTKLWNASRFCEMNECKWDDDFDPKACEGKVSQWIIARLDELTTEVGKAIESYRYNEAANDLYRFTWDLFCDWYIEFAKPLFDEGSERQKKEIRGCTAWVLNRLLHLLNPIMPFVTEELKTQLGFPGEALITSPWPEVVGANYSAAAEEMDWVIRAISEIRAARAEMNVPPAAKVELHIQGANDQTSRRISEHEVLLKRLARLEATCSTTDEPKNALQCVVDEATFMIPLDGVIDFAKERARIEKELGKLDATMKKLDAKLNNQGFLAQAPDAVVEEKKLELSEATLAKDKLSKALERLGV